MRSGGSPTLAPAQRTTRVRPAMTVLSRPIKFEYRLSRILEYEYRIVLSKLVQVPTVYLTHVSSTHIYHSFQGDSSILLSTSNLRYTFNLRSTFNLRLASISSLTMRLTLASSFFNQAPSCTANNYKTGGDNETSVCSNQMEAVIFTL